MNRFTTISALFVLSITLAFVMAEGQSPTTEDEGGAVLPQNPVPLAQDLSDIKTDPNVTWGVLDCGLRYAILPNAEPPGRLSVRLHVDAGSLMEADDQQGLAHFLEHMAFNGTTHFVPGSMVKYFQRLGMGFGNHTNAHTSFNETVYKLELPDTEQATLDDSFKLLRDYADGMLFPEAEIERERGIIMSEKRDRDSVRWRAFVDSIKFAFPENQLSKRLPIGTEEVILGAPRERFVEFYNSWYTPNRMVVVAVGDIEVNTIEAQVNKHFGSLESVEKTPDPDLGKLTQRGLASHYYHDPEAAESSVSIEVIGAPSSLPHNLERAGIDLRLSLATQMVNRRLGRIAKDEASPINSGRMYAGDYYDLGIASYASISADCKPEDWQDALKVVEQEARRVLDFGFTAAEVKEAVANKLNTYENAAEQADTRKSKDIANLISRALGNRKVFTHPADAFAWAAAELEQVTGAQCQAALQQLWTKDREVLLMLTGNAEVEGAKQQLTEVYQESAAVVVTAPKDEVAAEFAYAVLPEVGVIAERKEIEDLEVTQIKFANHVRLNLKVTDFEEQKISLSARIGGGMLTEPKAQPGLGTFVTSAFSAGGLEAHSDDDLKRLFAGKSVRTRFAAGEDAFTMTGSTNMGDLKDQLLLIRAYLTNPGFRKESVVEFHRRLDYLYQQLDRTVEGVAQSACKQYLYGGDSRFGYPERSVLEGRTIEEARAWVEPALKQGYLELSLVGDFDKEKAIELVAQTLGSLPERSDKKPDYANERKVQFPAGGEKHFTYQSEINKGMVLVYWPTIDIYDIKKTRRIGMLGTIFDDRLRETIREELGDAYSPYAYNRPSDTWADYGTLLAAVGVDPKQSDSVAKVVAEISSELATGESITQDELDRAKNPHIVSIEEMRRTNPYWLNSVLGSSQEYPERLGWSRHFINDYKSITLEEVNAMAKEFLKDQTRVTIVIKPEG